jgi:hypothetical protein
MLNTHKGTVVRAILKFGNGAVEELNPLKQNIGGIVFDRSALKGILSITGIKSLRSDGWSLLDSAGDTHKRSKEYSGHGSIKSVSVLVVYPDGTVWEGKIGGTLRDVSLIAWSDGIIRSLSDPSEILRFYKSSWQETPTSIVVQKAGLEILCSRIQHTCGKQCD